MNTITEYEKKILGNACEESFKKCLTSGELWCDNGGCDTLPADRNRCLRELEECIAKYNKKYTVNNKKIEKIKIS